MKLKPQLKWIRAFKVLLMLLSIFLIYYQVKSGDVKSSLLIMKQHLASDSTGRTLIYITLLLMPVNWLLEAIKWRMLTRTFYTQSLLRSLRAVLSGIAVSFFTPNRSGDFAGRILHLPGEHRINGAVYSIAGSVSQLIVTVTTGVFSLLLVFDKIFTIDDELKTFIYIILPMSVVGFHILFFRIPVFGDYLAHLKFPEKWMDRLSSIKHIDRVLLVKVYALSVLRYAVFTLQFWLILQVFGNIYTGWQPLALIMTSFLFITFVPSFALSEIGVRGSVCVFLFTSAGHGSTEVLIASTAVWLVNVAIPAAAGAVSMLYFKLGS